MADTLVSDFDVVELLDRLAGHCTVLLDAAAAGLLLADQRGSLRVVAASVEQVRLLELIQLQNDEGPCLDSYRSGRPVSAENLATAQGRWPLFAREAVEAGFHSVHALPMRLREQCIGTLNLFRVTAGPLEEADARIGQALADVATIGILQERAVRRGEVLVEQLQVALNSRIVIEQAKGMLAEHAMSNVADAFALLRGFARDTNRRLSDVALDVVAGRLPARQLLEHSVTSGETAG